MFLRPTTEDTIVGLNATENDHYRFEVAPFKKPTDKKLVEENPEITNQSHTSLSHIPFNERPGNKDANHPFALRLGFDTIENPSQNGFTVGGTSWCNIRFPGLEEKCYFSIHYLFKTGALMITAYKRTKVGLKVLQEGQSLLMMHDTILWCAPELEFLVGFPEIRNCAQSHKACYENYAAQFGVNDALYLATFKGDPSFVKEYQIMEPLGEGGFGKVLKGVHKRTGSFVAIKIISMEDPSDLQEVKMLQTLEHISQNLVINCIY